MLIIEKYNSLSTLKIHGDVVTVLNGNVTSQNAKKIPLNTFKYGLGAGSYSEEMNFGETIVLDNVAHGFFGKKETAEEFVKSPFLMGVGPEQNIDGIWQLDKSISIIDFYEEMQINYSLGMAIVGDFLFENLKSCFLKKSPIFHENINTNKEMYWQEAPTLKEVRGTTFGVVITEKGKKEFKENILRKAFYNNPNEKGVAPFFNHTHVLGPEGARHLLTDSILRAGKFTVYDIINIAYY